MSEKVIKLTDDNFEEIVFKSGKVVFVDFFAEWCGPCRMVSPIVAQIAEENKDDKLIFGKINVDESRKTAGDYKVRSIPIFIIFKNGEPVDNLIGAQPKERILEFIKRNQ